MNAIGITHVGNVRATNEDAVLISNNTAPYYALVADGMGGHAAGEVASALAASAVRDYLDSLGTNVLDADQIVDSIQFANRQILDSIHDHPAYEGMGTTLTLAYMEPDSVTVGHVGDSSAYLITDSGLKKITRDHTYLQRLIDSGAIGAEAASDFPYKNIITRALGTSPLQVDVYRAAWQSGDRILLCSDGLTAYADQEQLLAELTSEGDIQIHAQHLLEFALKSGGRDNISIIIAENPNAAGLAS